MIKLKDEEIVDEKLNNDESIVSDSLNENVTQKKSLAKNSIFMLVYNVLNVLVPLIFGIYVARVLSEKIIGEVTYAQNIAQYFVILAFLGIPTYGLREISKHFGNKEKINKTFTELFIINFISSVIFSIIYLGLILIVPSYRSHLTLYLITGSLIVFNILDITWLYEGLEEFGFISLRNLVFKLLSIVCLVLFVRDEDDYLIFAAIHVGCLGFNYLTNILFHRRYVRFDFKNLNLKQHLKPIIFLVVVNLAIEIYTLVDITMLGIFDTKESVTFYSYASKTQKILIQIISTFTIVLVPRISLMYKQKKFEEFNKLLSNTLLLIITLSLPMVVGIIFVSKDLMILLYGDSYYKSGEILMVLSLLAIISPIGYLLGSRVMLVTNNEKFMVIPVASGAIINVVLNLILINTVGVIGAAIASVISEIVVCVVYISLSHKYYKINIRIKEFIKILFALLLMALYCFVIYTYLDINIYLKLATVIGGAIGIYFVSLFILRESIVIDGFNKVMKKI
ncbi:MAG: flippase [Acholeplasmatales bacterium]|nr:flippase [Acholeplasmatales bacterium]